MALRRLAGFRTSILCRLRAGSPTSGCQSCALPQATGAAADRDCPYITLRYFIPPTLLSGCPDLGLVAVFAPEGEIDVVATSNEVRGAVAARGAQVCSVDHNLALEPLRMESLGLCRAATGSSRCDRQLLCRFWRFPLSSMLTDRFHKTNTAAVLPPRHKRSPDQQAFACWRSEHAASRAGARTCQILPFSGGLSNTRTPARSICSTIAAIFSGSTKDGCSCRFTCS